jgi:hypothetical protein
MAAKKKTSKKTGAKQTSKSAFVRSLPEGTSAKEAVAKAKAAGMDLTEAYFYGIRSNDRVAAKKKVTVGPVKAKGAAPTASGDSSLETTFRKLVLDLGLARAKALIEEVERGLQAVIAGK